MLEGYDLVLVAGSSVFPYYPNIPGEFLPGAAQLVAITSDADEAARAPMGDAIVADVGLTLRRSSTALSEPAADREPPPARVELEPYALGEPLSGGDVHAISPGCFPDDGIIVLESPSSTAALRNQLRLSRPGSYYFAAGGGLGFGLAASLGVQLAEPEPPGRLRARRGLGAVRDHRLLDRGRVRRPGQVPRAAQQRVLDPQVVRARSRT